MVDFGTASTGSHLTVDRSECFKQYRIPSVVTKDRGAVELMCSVDVGLRAMPVPPTTICVSSGIVQVPSNDGNHPDSSEYT
eukprot:CAMPEP_0195535154 /NCGR_PEP_ID=MMETSP0794_2-20130614/43741_1 /TAXON_ID=515487 /ORGANISM="Stephanopyxis turris, Strain CCMP 815" /LENGTH=80 /DNA_ID=CAMNT_0040668213 /DNA_START=218 /DNA_END=456 /DNA_ORIENTATION=-